MSTFATVIQLIYVAAASCFVLGLHLMNNPATARHGNQVSTAGMIAAIAATLALIIHDGTVSVTGWIVLGSGTLVGSAIGLYSARTVRMTAMPQLVSIFNAVGGGAAALVGIHDYMRLTSAGSGVAVSITVPTLLDVIIGAVTFSGSIIAAGKLQGMITSAPITFPGARAINVLLAVIALGAGGYLIASPSLIMLGVVIVGPQATELINAGVIGITAEATIETMADSIAAHPTLAESVKEAALVALGRPIHLPPAKAKAKAAAAK